MRAARLHGPADLRLEELPDPTPAGGEILLRIEGCGVCPTDVRKFDRGSSDGYPLNPGHEWVGRIEAVGSDVTGWTSGQRVYGDTYAGYAELATLAVEPSPWSHGPLLLPEELCLDRAVFVEPLADCLHAVIDQGRVTQGDHVVVVGGGQMGLQLVLAASLQGAEVTLVEPLEERRALGSALGGAHAVSELGEVVAEADVVVLSVGVAALVEPCIALAAPGGRVVLFAGFGASTRAEVDLERLHYREIAVVGSEWIGTPPNQKREHYVAARQLLVSGRAPLERLVTRRCGLDELVDVFADVRAHRGLKAVLLP